MGWLEFPLGSELTELDEQEKGRFEAGKGGASPEGREGLFHQIFQAFQLHPAGEDAPQLLWRHGGMMGTVQTASLPSAFHAFATLLAHLPRLLRFSDFPTGLYQVTGFLGTATHWVGMLLHPYQSPLPLGGGALSLLF